MARDPEKQRAAKRRYYERNPQVYRDKNDRKRARLRQMVVEAKCVPCADCERTYPFYVMDFDHRDPEDKQALISKLVDQCSRSRLMAEMAKCDVVCANCHRRRTFQHVARDLPELRGLASDQGVTSRQLSFSIRY